MRFSVRLGGGPAASIKTHISLRYFDLRDMRRREGRGNFAIGGRVNARSHALAKRRSRSVTSVTLSRGQA